MTQEQLIKLGQLIYNKIKEDYHFLSLGKTFEKGEMLSERILAMVSDENKEALLAELINEQNAKRLASKENFEALAQQEADAISEDNNLIKKE